MRPLWTVTLGLGVAMLSGTSRFQVEFLSLCCGSIKMNTLQIDMEPVSHPIASHQPVRVIQTPNL
uniref:Uncharacterized protein n=1 Tax=Anguilla anguilla TaxID=7936 RepID=A0A0E9TMW6_ANGAN